MQPREKIVRSTWNLVQSLKDVVAVNVANAARSGQIRVEQQDVQKLVEIVTASLDEGYEKAHRTHDRTVVASLQDGDGSGAKKNSPGSV